MYATQSSTNNGLKEGQFQSIANEENVQKRREEMGITLGIEDYASSMGFEYSIPTKEEATQRAQQSQVAYNENLQKAKEAMSRKDYTTAAENYLRVIEGYGHITAEDFVEAARAFSLAEHKESKWAVFYQIKAIAKGWKDIDQFENNPDFGYLKTTGPKIWEDLENVMKQQKDL